MLPSALADGSFELWVLTEPNEGFTLADHIENMVSKDSEADIDALTEEFAELLSAQKASKRFPTQACLLLFCH